MSLKPSVRQPQQDRSRDTLRRLLSATIKILDERGLGGASIPRIAAEAGIAPAGVYRRFADKDALLRAAFLEMLRQNVNANRKQLNTLLLRETLKATAERLIDLQFQQYRSHPHLFRALSRYTEADTDHIFIQQARSLTAESIEEVVEVLLAHRSHIAHSSPEPALRLAVLQLVSSIELIALEPASIWHTIFPAMTEDQLKQELARSFVSYLQREPP